MISGHNFNPNCCAVQSVILKRGCNLKHVLLCAPTSSTTSFACSSSIKSGPKLSNYTQRQMLTTLVVSSAKISAPVAAWAWFYDHLRTHFCDWTPVNHNLLIWVIFLYKLLHRYKNNGIRVAKKEKKIAESIYVFAIPICPCAKKDCYILKMIYMMI